LSIPSQPLAHPTTVILALVAGICIVIFMDSCLRRNDKMKAEMTGAEKSISEEKKN